ncbi:centriole, cilia and spindle-associated protein-like isoform X2 [Acanthaster planci]|uniref:Centriole, cilia and spindle-associated protein-like isoform X2 n=1 Tax=Acanthaster planci TaxID=133434 RepID=A0A8B7YX80_ACAPL|nr:centriole, cilia and spindle-associated protein-like isoform X2 [Acanthaster planci]
MVFKKSEYRKQYRDPKWGAHFPHYQEKVDYRVNRRRLEHHHQILDWDWDSENGNGEDGAGEGRPAMAPNRSNNNQVRRGRRAEDREVQTPDWSKMRDDQLQDQNGVVSGGRLGSSPVLDRKQMKKTDGGQRKDSKSAQSTRKHKTASKHPSRDRRQVRPRTSSEKKADTGRRGPDRPPMVAYGWADEELTTGCKKTHNIRASADIYPSALRAMRRRQLDIQQRAERDRQHSLRERRLKAMFNVPPQDDSVWLTEYQRNFTGPSQPR